MSTQPQRLWHDFIATDIKNFMPHIPALNETIPHPMGFGNIELNYFQDNVPHIIAVAENLMGAPNVNAAGDITLYDLEHQRSITICLQLNWGCTDGWSYNKLQMTDPSGEDYIDPNTPAGQKLTSEMTALKAKFGL